MQGLEAGYIAGLGTIAGNMVWIGSVIFGFRFFVIPWLSFDLFRYFLGFVLLIKYMLFPLHLIFHRKSDETMRIRKKGFHISGRSKNSQKS
jgi:hypothetical protein